jgi:dihydroorotate dehydrogenase (fumarate)
MSVDLSTRYLGLNLRNPIVASASPMTGSIESLKRLQDAGVGAVVLPSLFEEQIEHEEMATHNLRLYGAEHSPEAQGFFPEMQHYDTGADTYLKLVADARKALSVPVIASLNGYTPGGWTRIAKQLEDAGARRLDSTFIFCGRFSRHGHDGRAALVDLVARCARSTAIPVAVKVAPYFSAMASMAVRLARAGASGLVLFNRFVQPDIMLEELEVAPHLVLSTSDELRLALRWIAILHGRVAASLAATGGAHTPEDVLKLLLAGADCVMVASSLLRNGPQHVETLVRGVRAWMSEREYESVTQLKGSLSQQSCPDPDAFERANYMKALKSYTSEFVYHRGGG